MIDLSAEPLSTDLIERYLRTRGRRYFRGRHDGEFFFVLDAGRRLRVHLEIPPAHPDVFTMRFTPACFFPAAERPRLTKFAGSWNKFNRDIAAVVHGSSDPQRVGVTGEQTLWIADPVDYVEFAAFADRATDAAIDLFTGLNVVELPSPTTLLDAS
ncbi:hypothetical protein [Mycobacterium vicinigordonae]|uniref:YbjN domain-containing protein n=1 Tax=Mycobacterium vicinigordonae TaxID=1719132 RepID=A0A7D6E253_9MYCO|nr:hypothetical protein [Mycobacterium vicinigordonae]QLL06906.1 hypothetical protein H0P51_24980 [Mycobacterium vicinigordonae]